MNKTLGAELLAYSLCMLLLALLERFATAGAARTTVITGIAGATLCTLFALAAFAGATGKALLLLTLTAISFVLLWEEIHLIWPESTSVDSAGRIAAILGFVMLFLSISMIVMIAGTRAFDPKTPPADDASHPGTKPGTPAP